ncbi:hypothetical protein RhiirA1_483125 [Rhizophagus irregularis]|uniref:Protein kinase domain-containing protein n=1 Tax=Rhizophagus irregularis TaxID=588596 RepID=A0A2N0QKZ8_9GLOM|nr:hypothetical protein RhiirA1_483125 [Rhizophagus irregularis]
MLKVQVKAKSHLTISNKYPENVQCFGLTQNPSNRNYMLVINKLDVNLREYLQQNHNQLTWEERIKITFLIINAFHWIHKENSIIFLILITIKLTVNNIFESYILFVQLQTNFLFM